MCGPRGDLRRPLRNEHGFCLAACLNVRNDGEASALMNMTCDTFFFCFEISSFLFQEAFRATTAVPRRKNRRCPAATRRFGMTKDDISAANQRLTVFTMRSSHSVPRFARATPNSWPHENNWTACTATCTNWGQICAAQNCYGTVLCLLLYVWCVLMRSSKGGAKGFRPAYSEENQLVSQRREQC